MALSLIPPVGWSFAGPWQSGKPEELLEQVRAMPRKRISAELANCLQRPDFPSWAHRLADDAGLYRQFADGLASLYAVLLGPYEVQLTDLFMADRTVRMRQFLDGGVEYLLAQANPRWMRWKPPVLEIQMANGIDYDLYLEGRGIVLMPSLFCARSIVEDYAPQPVVSYPAGHDWPLRRLTVLVPEVPKSASAVSALLGRTRAAVLTAIAEHPGCSTTELAALVGIAPASASEHATVLRQAGLISTTRHRNAAIHSPTGLGVALLNRSADA
jgi:DNA-binding MarR family transcriptional regulator